MINTSNQCENLHIGESFVFEAHSLPVNETSDYISWTSSNPEILQIDNNGVANAVKQGKVNVIAQAKNFDIVDSCRVRVLQPVNELLLYTKDISIKVGEEFAIPYIVLPFNADNKNLLWGSSDNSVASVNDGKVKALKAGSTRITAKSEDNIIITDFCDITVTQPVLNKDYALYDSTPYIQAYSVEDANISYTRTFTNKDWQPLYVPSEMSYEDWKEDFEVAYINNFHQFDTDGDDVMDEMQLEMIKVRSGSLYANYPYLIKAKTTGEKTLTFEGKTLYPSEENSIDCSSSTTKYTFTGTYSEIKGLKTKEYYVLSSAGLCMIDNDDVPLKPFRWYMKMEDRGSVVNSGAAKAKITSIQIVEADEDEATGIVANAGGEESGSDNIYDMSGRKVSDSERSSLSKGIYIKNNKKFIIKIITHEQNEENVSESEH